MKKFLSLLIVIVLLLTCCVAAACSFGVIVKVFLHHYDDLDTTRILIYDSSVDLPTPTRNNYTFDGWYLDDDGNEAFVPHTEMDRSFHLYAKWTPIGEVEDFDPTTETFTVTFVYCDGATQNSTATVKDGLPVSLPTPTRQDYRFDGWWTEQTGGEQWTVQKVTSDITLYAHWTEQKLVGTHTEHVYESYFMYAECSYEGCSVVGRTKGNRIYDNMYNYNSAKGREITAHYNACQTALNGTVTLFVAAFETYSRDLDYLDGQYYWATLYYDVRGLSYTTI